MIKKKTVLVASTAIVAALGTSVGLAACGNGGNGGGTGGSTPYVQTDERYSNEQLGTPNNNEPTDGTVLYAPDDYVPAYKSTLENNTEKVHKIDEAFTVENVTYTVHAPSKVHASSLQGMDAFYVDIDMASTEQVPLAQTQANSNLFFYSPNGLYTSDLVEQAHQQEQMEKLMAYEAEGREITPEEYDELYSNNFSGVDGTATSATRRCEISYNGDGVYTVEVRDFINKELHRVSFNIQLDPSKSQEGKGNDSGSSKSQ